MLSGRVIRGSGLSKNINFPTANLDIPDFDYKNKEGVYAGYAFIYDKKYPAAIAILSNPKKFEVHFLNFKDADFYGETVSVELLDKISNIKKIEDRDKLADKISGDIEKIKIILNKNGL